MTNEQIQDLIDRYTQGKATPEEAKSLERWYTKEEQISDWTITEEKKSMILQSMSQNINTHIHATSIRPIFRYWAMGIAASLLIAISFWWIMTGKGMTGSRSEQFVVQTVPIGKMLKLTLGDGSVITMNSSTKIKYPVNFGHKERRVILLQGEAYFDVKHEEDRPFIVESGGVNTQVLGTAFNISCYGFSNSIMVTVARGKVSVTNISLKRTAGQDNSTMLLPNEQVSINKTSGVIQHSQVDAADVSAWTDGRLIFKSEKMADVASILYNKFKTPISFKEDTIKKIRISGGFGANDNLDFILFALTRSNHLVYTRSAGVVLLSLDN